MAAVESVSAETRDRAGKGAARESRRNGRVPAVIYGDKKEPTLISLDPKEIDRLIHKKTFYATLLDVDLKGTKHRVLPRDVQFDPVTDRTLHVDFDCIAHIIRRSRSCLNVDCFYWLNVLPTAHERTINGVGLAISDCNLLLIVGLHEHLNRTFLVKREVNNLASCTHGKFLPSALTETNWNFGAFVVQCQG